jgi:hypothetical protein
MILLYDIPTYSYTICYLPLPYSYVILTAINTSIVPLVTCRLECLHCLGLRKLCCLVRMGFLFLWKEKCCYMCVYKISPYRSVKFWVGLPYELRFIYYSLFLLIKIYWPCPFNRITSWTYVPATIVWHVTLYELFGLWHPNHLEFK